MLFNSFTYAIFLIIIFGTYWLLPNKWRNYFLLLSSYFFYGTWKIEGLLLLLGFSKASRINNNAGGFEDFRNIVRKEAITQLIKSEEGRYEELYRNLKYWRFEPSKTYLEDFIKLASQAKVKVIFVEMPITHLHNQMAQKSFYRKEYFEQLNPKIYESRSIGDKH